MQAITEVQHEGKIFEEEKNAKWTDLESYGWAGDYTMPFLLEEEPTFLHEWGAKQANVVYTWDWTISERRLWTSIQEDITF